MLGECAFCKSNAELRDSHVLPAFAFRWVRSRSPNGHLRNTASPNRRVQDGLKLPWLCGKCEGDFSKHETAFATKVFHPWHEGNQKIPYQDWLLKFCVSVSWRVLKYARGRNPEAEYTAEQSRLMDEAEQRWRNFLNDEVPHPGQFEQHLVIFDLVESTSVENLPSNFNRFMTGAVTLDIVGSEKSLMTFAKLGRFLIFGIVQKGPNRWDGSKVHVKDGRLEPREYTLPAGLLPMFREKASFAQAAMQSISAAQREKIDKNVEANLDEFALSDQFASILADANMFGVDAVVHKTKEK